MRRTLQYSQSRLLMLMLVAVLLIAACQEQPPVVYYIVLSPTPEDGAPTAVVANNTVEATQPPPTDIVPTETPTLTPTVDPRPTGTVNVVQVAEERFQHGFMFWLRPTQQIWVMIEDPDDLQHGTWRIYDDTFVEGEPEIDPTIIPPEDMMQPERGFGKLWRENPEIRQALGWAIGPEFGHVTDYYYLPGGTVNSDNVYVPGPGFHVLRSLGGKVFRFYEEDSTWEQIK